MPVATERGIRLVAVCVTALREILYGSAPAMCLLFQALLNGSAHLISELFRVGAIGADAGTGNGFGVVHRSSVVVPVINSEFVCSALLR